MRSPRTPPGRSPLRERRPHRLHAAPAVDEELLQAPRDVLQALVDGRFLHIHGLTLRGLGERGADVAPRVGGDERLHGRRTLAAESEGVRRRLGRADDGEEADEGVEAVGDGDRDARVRPGERVAGGARQRGLEDRLAERVAEALALRVVLPHDAGEGGELGDELRGEVRLREARRLGRHLRVRVGEPERLRERGRELLDPRGLLQHRPELGLERDPLELGLERRERPLGVRLVEEPRVWYRAVSTDSFPTRTASSSTSPFAAVMKCGRSSPLDASSTGKYLWCLRMTITSTSLGSAKNAGSKSPRMSLGDSTRFTTSSISPPGSPELGGTTPFTPSASAIAADQMASRRFSTSISIRSAASRSA